MRTIVKDPRNFWVGSMFAACGAAAILIGRDYEFGSAGAMGAGYFPSVLGGLLTLIGVVRIALALRVPGAVVEPFALRRLALVIGAILAFGLLLEGGGLVPAVLALVMIGSAASDEFHAGRSAVLALGLALFAVLVFSKGLGLPLNAFGSWFGG